MVKEHSPILDLVVGHYMQWCFNMSQAATAQDSTRQELIISKSLVEACFKYLAMGINLYRN